MLQVLNVYTFVSEMTSQLKGSKPSYHSSKGLDSYGDNTDEGLSDDDGIDQCPFFYCMLL
jgi:hypothetical protein